MVYVTYINVHKSCLHLHLHHYVTQFSWTYLHYIRNMLPSYAKISLIRMLSLLSFLIFNGVDYSMTDFCDR